MAVFYVAAAIATLSPEFMSCDSRKQRSAASSPLSIASLFSPPPRTFFFLPLFCHNLSTIPFYFSLRCPDFICLFDLPPAFAAISPLPRLSLIVGRGWEGREGGRRSQATRTRARVQTPAGQDLPQTPALGRRGASTEGGAGCGVAPPV